MTDNRKEFVVTIGGLPHTMLLDEVDVARYGDAAREVKAAPKPENKGRSAANKKG